MVGNGKRPLLAIGKGKRETGPDPLRRLFSSRAQSNGRQVGVVFFF
jgi:hypothetical protein